MSARPKIDRRNVEDSERFQFFLSHFVHQNIKVNSSRTGNENMRFSDLSLQNGNISSPDKSNIFKDSSPQYAFTIEGVPFFPKLSSSFNTDTQISSNFSVRRRELTKFEPQLNKANDMNLNWDTSNKGRIDRNNRSYNQLRANEEKFGISLEFDETKYTSGINRNDPQYAEKLRYAKHEAHILQEMERRKHSNVNESHYSDVIPEVKSTKMRAERLFVEHPKLFSKTGVKDTLDLHESFNPSSPYPPSTLSSRRSRSSSMRISSARARSPRSRPNSAASLKKKRPNSSRVSYGSNKETLKEKTAKMIKEKTMKTFINEWKDASSNGFRSRPRTTSVLSNTDEKSYGFLNVHQEFKELSRRKKNRGESPLSRHEMKPPIPQTPEKRVTTRIHKRKNGRRLNMDELEGMHKDSHSGGGIDDLLFSASKRSEEYKNQMARLSFLRNGLAHELLKTMNVTRTNINQINIPYTCSVIGSQGIVLIPQNSVVPQNTVPHMANTFMHPLAYLMMMNHKNQPPQKKRYNFDKTISFNPNK
ncbi:hypothetical protein PCE1_002432 [Barthelona sp. PCE]